MWGRFFREFIGVGFYERVFAGAFQRWVFGLLLGGFVGFFACVFGEMDCGMLGIGCIVGGSCQ